MSSDKAGVSRQFRLSLSVLQTKQNPAKKCVQPIGHKTRCYYSLFQFVILAFREPRSCYFVGFKKSHPGKDGVARFYA
jgi:hypothetical protein